ncbi:3BP5L protein, partial [Certhia brachydactyla]|nr:3BP5L protein [Certhia brachydactyla]
PAIPISPLPQEHKSRVNSLESAVSQAKLRYSVALRNLEQISEELHARRFQRILRKKHRENPLGAEGGPQNPEIPGIPGGKPQNPGGNPWENDGILEESDGILGENPGILGENLGILGEFCPWEDSLSVLSLQSSASEMQKFHSGEHLSGISGISGMAEEARQRRQRSLSL